MRSRPGRRPRTPGPPRRRAASAGGRAACSCTPTPRGPRPPGRRGAARAGRRRTTGLPPSDSRTVRRVPATVSDDTCTSRVRQRSSSVISYATAWAAPLSTADVCPRNRCGSAYITSNPSTAPTHRQAANGGGRRTCPQTTRAGTRRTRPICQPASRVSSSRSVSASSAHAPHPARCAAIAGSSYRRRAGARRTYRSARAVVARQVGTGVGDQAGDRLGAQAVARFGHGVLRSGRVSRWPLSVSAVRSRRRESCRVL